MLCKKFLGVPGLAIGNVGIAGLGITPVSYTHLDVYKRQVLEIDELHAL